MVNTSLLHFSLFDMSLVLFDLLLVLLLTGQLLHFRQIQSFAGMFFKKSILIALALIYFIYEIFLPSTIPKFNTYVHTQAIMQLCVNFDRQPPPHQYIDESDYTEPSL